MKINIRKDRMTKKERWLALVNRKPMDRVPFYALAMGFSTFSQGNTIADLYNKPQKNFDAMTTTAAKYGLQEIPWVGYAAWGAWEFGGDVKWPSGEYAQAPSVARHPVITEEDGWNLKVPDVKTAGFHPLEMELSKLVAASDEPFIHPTYGPFTSAANMVGVEKFCKWIMKKPDLAHHMLRVATDFFNAKSLWYANTFPPGRLLPWTFDTVAANQIISPKQFEAFCLPYQKEVHQKILDTGVKHIMCHICGEQNENLPYWQQIPFGDPGILSFGHEIDLGSLQDVFPKEIVMGNVNPSIILTGTPEEVYEETRVVIEKGRTHPGGFMLSAGCEFPPGASEDKMWAMVQAVSDFGWYE